MQQKVKSNEPEFTSQVVSWMNSIIEKGNLPFEIVTSEPSIKISGDKTRFPDIQIWLNRRAGHGFCLCELKPPEVKVDNSELLKVANEKTQAMNADYFVTWNMKDTVIWRSPKNEIPVSREHRLKTYPPLYQIKVVDDLFVEYKKDLLFGRAKELIYDLANLYREGHLHLIETDTTFFVHLLYNSVSKLWPYLYNSLLQQVGSDKKFKEELFDWAVKQGISNFGDPIFYEIISRQTVYRLVGKILFYLTLRRFRSDLPKFDLSEINERAANKKIKEYFEIACRIDYQAVFELSFVDNIILPNACIELIAILVEDLDRFNFSNMPQEVLGSVFEQLVPIEERHDLGQYFTKENIVDIINTFCIRSNEDKVLDPTCGSGTFLIRAYDRLKILGQKKHSVLISNLWGIDIAHFPSELATINLYRQDISDYSNFPRVIVEDFFNVKKESIFKFPPPKPLKNSQFMIEEKIPMFGSIVSNFPYIRQEIISERIKGYKSYIEKVIAKDWLSIYPEAFNLSLEKYKETKQDLSLLYSIAGLKLSGQADIFAYLFFHATAFLIEGGRIGIVTSNSWLDVAYGYELQKFFLNNFKIIAILESRCEPWFDDPSINTIITILERCSDKEIRDNNIVKFVKVKKRLKELIPWDMKVEAVKRWQSLDSLIYSIEKIDFKNDEYIDYEVKQNSNELKTFNNDNFRIRAIKQKVLGKSIKLLKKTDKWGRFLRAPDVYFDILSNARDKFIYLNEIAEVRRGYTTGRNEFFYLSKERIAYWGIENDFLFPVLRSPREFKSILIDIKKINIKVFICNKSKKELKLHNKTGALKYIEWGEKQKTNDGVPWPNAPTVSNRKYWYLLPQIELSNIFWTKAYDDKFIQRYSEEKIHADQRVYFISEKTNISSKLLAAVMNSTLFSLFVELVGRVNLGEGALDTSVEETRDYMLIPDIRKFSPKMIKDIEKKFEIILSREIKAIDEEIKLKDRKELDLLILKAIGLEKEIYLNRIYTGLEQLVKERIQLSKLRKNVKKVKIERDIETLISQVSEEVFPNGPPRFPEEFLNFSLNTKDYNEIPIHSDPMRLGDFFMGLQDVISDSGFRYQAKSVDEAKYIIYSQKNNNYIVKVPKEMSVIIKTIDNYENYLKSIYNKINSQVFRRVLDHKLSNSITKDILEKNGLTLAQ